LSRILLPSNNDLDAVVSKQDNFIGNKKKFESSFRMETNEIDDDFHISPFKEKQLSKTFKSNVYINTKIDYLKTRSPGFLAHDIMGFDEI